MTFFKKNGSITNSIFNSFRRACVSDRRLLFVNDNKSLQFNQTVNTIFFFILKSDATATPRIQSSVDFMWEKFNWQCNIKHDIRTVFVRFQPREKNNNINILGQNQRQNYLPNTCLHVVICIIIIYNSAMWWRLHSKYVIVLFHLSVALCRLPWSTNSNENIHCASIIMEQALSPDYVRDWTFLNISVTVFT